MPMMRRDYQDEAIKAIWAYFYAGFKGNPIVAMPTGTGKSIIIADFVKEVIEQYPMQKILVLTHVKELIEQNHDKLMQQWPLAPAGIYSSGLKRRDTLQNVIFAGIGSVAKRAVEFGKVDLIVIDECHLVSPNKMTQYQKFINELLQVNPHVKVIGLTATPWRLGQGKLTDEGGLFTDICFDITTEAAFNRLIAEGYLAPLIPKRPSFQYDMDNVHMRGGEFIAKEMQIACDRDELTMKALQDAMEQGHDRKRWLIFTAGVEHAIHANDMLDSLGIESRVVHGGNKEYPMTDKERDANIAWFKEDADEIRAIVNNNILTTGFDHPPIDMIVMLRPTASASLWVQMLGRGTRPLYAPGFDLMTLEGRIQAQQASQKQNCLVLDFGGNTKRLGAINNPVMPKKKGKKKGEAPVKVCDGCNTYVPASVRFCEHCGYEFVFTTKLKQEASSDALIVGELPIVEDITVDHIVYSEHNKHSNKAPTLQVTYYSGVARFREWVCLEHEGFAGKKARDWWRTRSSRPDVVPTEIGEALGMIEDIKPATSIRVWVNKKYPEIMAYCYDGTHFGTQEPEFVVESSKETPDMITDWRVPTNPDGTIKAPERPKLQNNYQEPPIDFDDDIPF